MTNILQLKITLNDIKPAIWRRFLVEDSIDFNKLHESIQKVMGWANYHLYEFEVDKTHIESDAKKFTIDSMWLHSRPERRSSPASKTKLSQLLKTEKQKFRYIYDFGDCWEHTIVVEKIMEKSNSQKCPVCISGKRACPPEDCGSIWGYGELMEIRKDKNHPEYKERIVEWLGEDYDPDMFDIREVNNALQNRMNKKSTDIFHVETIKPDLNKSEQSSSVKIGRNDPCPCGSGKKYKRCCLLKEKEV
ncbi:MAG: plasmid pRiA4b ORF-3 family protein [Candidatus Nanohalarchaeota archaeon]|nr:MAG: plasmid pRiA4b ORF-3 family protein [Candidatus Nanohaloarchaeota archaeon]